MLTCTAMKRQPTCKHYLRDIYTNAGKHVGHPHRSCPWGAQKLCGTVYTAAPPLLMEWFFCQTCRNRECWLVIIYRSMTSATKCGVLKWWNRTRTHASVNTRPTRKTLLHPHADPLLVGVNAPLEWHMDKKGPLIIWNSYQEIFPTFVKDWPKLL